MRKCICRKFVSSVIAIIFSLSTINAWGNEYKIVMWFNNGNKLDILFSEYPIFIYEDGNLILKSSKSELLWPLSELAKFTVETDGSTETSIRNFPLEGLFLDFDNCEIYDINGKLLSKKVHSLSELATGIYIIKFQNVTTKVFIR